MRLSVAVLALALAMPLNAAQTPFDAALNEVRRVVHVEYLPDVNPHNTAVARETTGGAPVAFRRYVEHSFGTNVARELTDAYGEAGPARVTIDRESAGGYAVLPVERFAVNARDYDWQRLNAAYPDIRYVLRVSQPAADTLGAFAIVRYELISRDGHSWAAFTRLEKQPDGSWRAVETEVGDLWK